MKPELLAGALGARKIGWGCMAQYPAHDDRVWQPRFGRNPTNEDAQRIAENIITSRWPRAEIPLLANNTDKPTARPNDEAR